MLYSPLFHGAAGILDELLLFGAPLLVVLIILDHQQPPCTREESAARARTHPLR